MKTTGKWSEDDQDSYGSTSKQNLKHTSQSYSNVAQFKQSSPAPSNTSRTSKANSAPFRKLSFHGSLSHSQENPSQVDDELFSTDTASQSTDIKSECPVEYLTSLDILIESGVSPDVIKQAIKGWIQKSSAGFDTANL